ncbi:putative transcription factor TIFY family [Helianthus debilis subsp. tardiflorus]
MKRNCRLELRLVPPAPHCPFIFSDNRQQDPSDEISRVDGDLKEKENQQLTIIYDGKVSICDVTELQARAIIKIASEEMDGKWIKSPSSPLMSPSKSGLSMKRSLQWFLQKRKHRIQSTSPYKTQ